jgi:hypothetical protein
VKHVQYWLTFVTVLDSLCYSIGGLTWVQRI